MIRTLIRIPLTALLVVAVAYAIETAYFGAILYGPNLLFSLWALAIGTALYVGLEEL